MLLPPSKAHIQPVRVLEEVQPHHQTVHEGTNEAEHPLGKAVSPFLPCRESLNTVSII